MLPALHTHSIACYYHTYPYEKSVKSPTAVWPKKKPDPAYPHPIHPHPYTGLTEDPFWPSVDNNKPKPFKQSYRQRGRESYEAKIQRFTSHGVASLAGFGLCSALPEVKRREREGQCNWPYNAKSPCSSER